MIVPVHDEAIGDDQGKGGAGGGSDAAVGFAEGNAYHKVGERHQRIDNGAEFVHVLGFLYLDADVLYQRHDHEDDQEQGDRVGVRVIGPGPEEDKGASKEDEA